MLSPSARAAAAGTESDVAAASGDETASDVVAAGDSATGGDSTSDGGETDGGDGATPMETDEARQPAGAGDAAGQSAGAAGTGGTAPAQASESDASYYTEDLPIAAYQPVVTNVLQPLEHAGEDGDTEAAGGGARMQRGRQLNQRTRRRAKQRAAREAALLPTAGDGDSDGGQ